jgi:hypothetical protein
MARRPSWNLGQCQRILQGLSDQYGEGEFEKWELTIAPYVLGQVRICVGILQSSFAFIDRKVSPSNIRMSVIIVRSYLSIPGPRLLFSLYRVLQALLLGRVEMLA